MMNGRQWIAVTGLCVALACASVGCKRRPPAVKEMMGRMAGTWEWRQAGSDRPAIVVLELTARGKYVRTTYQEIAGNRRLLYEHRFKRSVVPEPENPTELEALKKEGYEPSIDRGAYQLILGERQNTITFESETLTRVETAEAMGTREQTIRQPKADELEIQSRTYRRVTPPPTP